MHLPRRILNLLEEVTSDGVWSLNQQIRDAAIQSILGVLFSSSNTYPSPLTPNSGILCGFQVVPSAGLSVQVNPEAVASGSVSGIPGIGIQYDTDNLPAQTINTDTNESAYRLLWLSAVSAPLAIAAADHTNPRIDLVEIQWNVVQAQSLNVNIFNPATATFVATPDYTQELPSVNIKVKTGTAEPSPVTPTADTGWLSIASVYVAANAASLVQANISDLRAMLVLNLHKGFQLIATDGTIHNVSLVKTPDGTYTLSIA